jgi:hypothetical protein
MYKKINRLFLNIALLLGTIFLLTMATEIVLRTVSKELLGDNWVGAEKKYYEYDPLLGWRKIPNTGTTRVSIRGRNSVYYQVNSKGFRGPEYPYKKPDNEYRILFLGDSFTEGYMIDMNDHFAEVMKQRLNSTGRKKFVNALNSGTAGWSTDQELLFFQNEAKKYSTDLTILMFFQNDLSYNNEPKDWSMYYKPLFKIRDGELILTNVPVPKPDKIVRSDQLSSKDRTISKIIREWLHANSYLYGLIKKRINNTYYLHKLAILLHLTGNDIDPADKNILLPREYNVWEKKYNEAVRDSWRITELMLKKLKEETDSIGSKLIIFFIPDEVAVHVEEWEKLKKKFGLSDDNYDIDKPGLELGAVCKRNDIDYLNPTAELKIKSNELAKINKRLYDPIDHHWTAEGNKIVGELLADYISLKYLKDN